jgi:uncharacterized protein (TIGR01244 family)
MKKKLFFLMLLFSLFAVPFAAQTAEPGIDRGIGEGDTGLAVISGRQAVAVPAAPQIETIPGVTNFARINDSFACSGALEPEAIAALKARGYTAILNLRGPEERSANVEQEAEAAQQAGLKYLNVPIRLRDPDVAEYVDKALAALQNPDNRPLLIHCTVGARAAAIWLIKRVMLDGEPVDKALPEAESAGLKQATIRQWALDYLKAHGK